MGSRRHADGVGASASGPLAVKASRRNECALTEVIESPSQQQSTEQHLVPRNYWASISHVGIRLGKKPSPRHFHSPGLRVRFSVPNSQRSVRTSFIQIQEASLRGSGEVLDIPVKIELMVEYKHDIRAGHGNDVEVSIETQSKTLARTKVIADGSISLGQVLQAPFVGTLCLYKNAESVATLGLEMFSLPVSQRRPDRLRVPASALAGDAGPVG